MEWNNTKPPLGSQIDWSHPLAKGIIGCWLFNEGMGDKVYDLSGNRNHGVMTLFSNDTTSGWGPSIFGTGIKFKHTDGNLSNRITISNFNRFLNLSQFTMSAWVKFYQSPIETDRTIFRGGNIMYGKDIGGAGGFNAYVNGEVPSSVNEFGYPFFSNMNYHIALTFDNSSVKSIYVNGVLRKSSANGNKTLQTITTLWIGYYAAGQTGFVGFIDTPIIHNRALTPSEVQQLYIEPFCFIK